MTESDSVTSSEPAVEEIASAEPIEPAQPESISPPGKRDKKKLLIMIVAIIVVAALIGTAAFVFVFSNKLKVTMSPGEIPDMPAGGVQALSVEVKWGSTIVDSGDDVEYSWSVDPSSLGDFDFERRASVSFEAGNSAGEGTIMCEVTYNGKTASVEADVVVEPPFLDTVNIVPSSKTLLPDQEWNFTATAVNSVGETVTDATFAWSASGADAGDISISPATGATVKFSCAAEAIVNLTAEATSGSEAVTGTSVVTVTSDVLDRTVDTLWYDMFNHPIGPWYDYRYDFYGDEWAITDEFPYMYIWSGDTQELNTWIYTFARMNVTARNLTENELSMNSNPEFMPFLSGPDGARGGTAILDMYMSYPTVEECLGKLGTQVDDYYDGWIAELNGTITLDKQAAKSVLGITDSQFDTFTTWWGSNQGPIESEWEEWLEYEGGNDRLAIYNAYEYWYDPLYTSIEAEKTVDDLIVLTVDFYSWGGEALMFRWLHESFLPTEWYMEDMNLHATIGPESADVDLDAAVEYAMYAYEATDLAGASCWAWEALMQDYLPSTSDWPISLFDQYKDLQYENFGPGSYYYGTWMDWDYTPGVWNLSAGETLTLEWPAEELIFFAHDEGGGEDPLLTDTLDIIVNEVRTYTAVPTCAYAEPMPSDAPDLISIDLDSRRISYEGPFDLWTWSKDQVEHEWLVDEWDRIGILPYGAPYVEFRAASDVVPEMILEDVPTSAEMGVSYSFNVTISDQVSGDPYTDYAGTVTFSSSDLVAVVLPADYTFVPADMGTHEFSVTFNTVDPVSHEMSHYLTVVDSDDSLLSDTVSSILVVESPVLASFEVAFENATAIAMESTSATVTALNQWDEVLTSYDGTVNFTSSDSGAVLPPNTTYDAVDDEGVKTFAVTYVTPGSQTLNATDVADPDSTGEDSITVLAERVADHYVVSGLDEDVGTNVTITVTVTIMDQYDAEFNSYSGSMLVTANNSDDFTEPPLATFVAGTPWVEVDVNFTCQGSFTVNFTDDSDSTIKASLAVEAWDEKPVMTKFDVTGITDMWENEASDVTVKAFSQYDSVITSYSGTIVFSSNASSGDTLPTEGLTFNPLVDKGVKVFSDGVSFDEPGVYNVTVTDVSDPTLRGSQENILIEDLVASYLEMTGPSTMTENTTFSVVVTAYHQHDEVFEEYDGEVSFETSLSSAYDVLPADYPFLPGDAGEHEFTGLSLSKLGDHTLTVEDTGDPSLEATLDIEITIRSTLTYRIYDMFEEEWGPWWNYRVVSPTWDTERPLTTDTGEVTYLYSTLQNPRGDLKDQGLIYAPYRWNVTGESISNLDVHTPMFTKRESSTPIAGAEASMHIQFQYLYPMTDGPGGWWEDYWIPEWGQTGDWVDGVLWADADDNDDWVANGESWFLGHDGYFMATYYEITMNRPAAEEWIGLPEESDPTVWWSTNKADYISDWNDWIIDDQGNDVYDIYCGYEWTYGAPGTMMRLDGDGDEVTLEIGHFSLGYEALMTRWLKASEISLHQPYFEDFEMVVDYRENNIDVTMDAVCQWSLHCVKQNATDIGEDAPCAWAWEPIGLDYLAAFGSHPSDYTPYYYLDYESWNCGDVNLGNMVGYEGTPWELDLLSYATLIVELPTGEVPGYYAETIPVDAIAAAWTGDISDYDAIRYYGDIEPGYMDLEGAAYTYVGNTLTIEGPCDFDNSRGDGYLYHGAPWLEFDVTPSTMAAEASNIVAPSVGAVAEEPVTIGDSAVSASTSTVCELVSLVGMMCAALLVIAALAVSVERRREDDR